MKTHGPVVLDIDGLELTSVDKDVLRHPQTGGLILFARNYEDPQQLRELVRSIRDVRQGLLICVDQEGGRVQRFKHEFSQLPCLQKIGQLYVDDPEKALQVSTELGWLMAFEVVAHDVDLSFAPVLDLDESSSVIIGDRSFSSDPATCLALAKAYIKGMNDAGMKATGKHFPGHGGVTEDSHLELPVDLRSYSDIEHLDLLPFSELVSDLGAVMPAHIVFPEVDSEPVGFSSVWLKDILIKKLGFNGVIFSDDLSMEGAAVAGNYKQRTEAALLAGCTSVLVCNHRDKAEQVIEFIESRNDLHIESKLEGLLHTGKIDKALKDNIRWQACQKIIESL